MHEAITDYFVHSNLASINAKQKRTHMKKLAKGIGFITIALLILIQAGCGSDKSSSQTGNPNNSNPSTNTSTTPNNLAQQINQYLELHQSDASAGISILVLKNGEEIYSTNKGMANLKSGTPISRQTGFRLASVSKTFTAIAIMQLVEKGELKLSDSILDYLPELSPTWKTITIDHLLTHQSGIYDIFNDFWNPSITNNLTMDGLMHYLIKNPDLEFSPGSKGDYSNTGYMLLAKIIERKTGFRFSEYMALNIFEPAKMKGSYINDENQAIKPGDAINHANTYTYYGITTYVKGSMAQVSSTEDFFNFFDALRKGKLISEQTLNTMTRKHSTLKYGDYGYGFQVAHNYYGHTGEWDGFETELVVDTGRHLEWIILTNSGKSGRNHINAINTLIRSAH